MTSDSSFINADLFIDWLNHFSNHTKPSESDPILLVLENHLSHCSIKAEDFFRQNNIFALTLPPHSSHKMQPLDRGFHGILKKYYAAECEKWLRSHLGRAITVFQMTSILTSAYNRAANVKCAVNSFRVTGIWPWNQDVFNDSDFMASSVTEQDNAYNFTGNMIESISKAAVTLQDPHSNKKVTIQTTHVDDQSPKSSLCTVSNYDQTTNTDIMTPSTSIKDDFIQTNLEYSQGMSISDKILNIKPFPTSPTKRCTRTKRKKSEIISSSPYKSLLKEAINQKVCREWWHEKCTGYLGFDVFKCIICLS
ncbi:unnamed protein product [Euphydryas editha]|uniref:DDE-1 domain-containing protein n=1 Tax=Euphydryas editha TaxID=104508 RepID=A0AAU9U8Y5_EUPED|nr:unnamed protein product [Euphydryas editha]